MDFTTIIGTLVAFGAVLTAMMMGEGGGLGTFLDVPSLALVFGGTIAVTLMNFPIGEIKQIVKVMMVTAMHKSTTPSEEIARIVSYANLARKEGLLALEAKLQEVDDAFF
ncbi:MAG: motility protein A, partial [Planctomycetota bacterium]|nr:motility protein A [Planctomycetota bacterium]